MQRRGSRDAGTVRLLAGHSRARAAGCASRILRACDAARRGCAPALVLEFILARTGVWQARGFRLAHDAGDSRQLSDFTRDRILERALEPRRDYGAAVDRGESRQHAGYAGLVPAVISWER